jgi:glycosyltransferase involved in cell wall biosynthesis
MREFQNNGHEVYVLTTLEKRFGKVSTFENDEGISVYRIESGNITKTPFFEKTLSLLSLNSSLIKADRRLFPKNYFDLIIVTTPSITFAPVVKKLKKRHEAFIYLLLKDMWPQGPVDLGAIKKYGPIWQFFRLYEKRMYEVADKIGCMSKGAVEFLLSNNHQLSNNKVEVCPNSLADISINIADLQSIYSVYNIPTNKIIMIYGGNISLSHGFEFFLECIKRVGVNKKVHFIIIGSGTHFTNVKTIIVRENIENVTLIDRLPYNDYQKILNISDIGIALLNPKYTVPQFPSKIIDYLRLAKPVLSITSESADVGKIISESGAGFNITSNKVEEFINIIEMISSEDYDIKLASKNARELFDKKFTTDVSYNIIITAYNQRSNDKQ